MSGDEGRKPAEPGIPYVVPDDAEPVAVPEVVEPVMPHVVNDTGEPIEGRPVPGEVVEVVEPERERKPEPEPRHGRDKG